MTQPSPIFPSHSHSRPCCEGKLTTAPVQVSRRAALGGLLVLGTAAWSGRTVGGTSISIPYGRGDDVPSRETQITRAVAFLKSRQEADGGWSSRRSVGITALAVTALLRSRRLGPADPTIVKGLARLEAALGPNGGFEENGQANYVTSIALMAFHQAAQADPNPEAKTRYDALIRRGQDFLKGIQWTEGKNKTPESDFYGGAGYRGDQSRPDLSNTAFMVEALRETGLPAADPALQKALIFISRCQNQPSEFNDQPWAGKVNDGGFIYTAANGGESKAGGDPATGLRSYAGMTYAGLKSMIHAGLDRDDPRVQGALRYIRNHYTLDENPGLGQVGLYYYYHTFAKAMSLLGEPRFTDAQGVEHDWKAELNAALGRRQNPDGSWVNPADRFMEGDPNLVTSYGLLALAYTG